MSAQSPSQTTAARTGVGALLASGERSFSFELFPPKTPEGEQRFWHTLRALEGLAPTFVSVTYGAGGTTRDSTVRLTGQIAAESTLTPVGHLTCVGSSVDDLRRVVGEYAASGVHDILALRGDPPGGPGQPWVRHPEGFDHAVELVSLVRSLGDFSVGVAAFPEGHPESRDLDQDVDVLRMKQDAGATFAITQFFFRAEDYLRLRDRAAAKGVTMPIVPGLIPVTDIAQITRFAQLQGSAFPAELAARFDAVANDPDAVTALGVEVATEIATEVLDEDSPGLHLYTLNRSTSTREVYAALGLS
jgi:methylenetetrahydrofolate reductase (NADPH)